MKFEGLTTSQVEESRQKYGSNKLTNIEQEPLWKKILIGFTDPMIMILLLALLVQTILFFLGETLWFEPVAILMTILIANGVASISQSKQESKALSLKEEEESKQICKVVREGILCEIPVRDVVVGDIVYLQAGDKIPADGEIIDGYIEVDQSSLNGETQEAKKIPLKDGDNYDTSDLLNKHYVYRGTVVCSHQAHIKVKTVGDATLFGKLALEVQEEQRATPLQVKLAKLAKQISIFGYAGSICIILSILIKTVVTGHSPSGLYQWIRLILDTTTVAVTIIVCAVPEGLPMLTSILLSFQSIRMAKDSVLVRKINGLETSGSLSILFSDKTGTITKGRLSVVEIATGNVKIYDKFKDMNSVLAVDVTTGIGLNNSSISSGENIIGGNSTDRALMSFLADSDITDSLARDDVKNFNPFDSNKKISSVVVKKDGKNITYIKGAPEKIIEKCTSYIDENGDVKKLIEHNYLTSYIDSQSGRSMRLIAVAKYDGELDFDENQELTLICVISIRDEVRTEAVSAIKQVQEAGIQVVMVTGDRKETAVAIAKEAGLLTSHDDIALTSFELSEKSDDELKTILPHLRVVSRALPSDKSRLVKIAQEKGHVVGMTGDGVNDSPALKKADVGFAMGSGTEVAKEAGDIIILDDNFSSIEKAILYGRTMFKSIRKFLVFQLTVNVAAVLTCFLGPLLGENVILTVIQLLVINLAMDSLAAIAFGSEPALEEYMKEKPVNRSENIVTKSMFIQTLTVGIYICFVCIGILFFAPLRNLFGDVDITYLKSAVFATFMMAITFNGFNARTSHINPFENLGRNKNFLRVILSIFILQLAFVTFGGKVLSVERLSLSSWMICIALAFMVIPVDMLRKMIVGKR